MVLFLIIRPDQKQNITLSALSVFAVQHFPFAVQHFPDFCSTNYDTGLAQHYLTEHTEPTDKTI